MSNEKERGILIVGQGKVGKTILNQEDKVVLIVGEPIPTPYNAPIPLPQDDYILPYFDGKSARNKRREAERNAKKKRK